MAPQGTETWIQSADPCEPVYVLCIFPLQMKPIKPRIWLRLRGDPLWKFSGSSRNRFLDLKDRICAFYDSGHGHKWDGMAAVLGWPHIKKPWGSMSQLIFVSCTKSHKILDFYSSACGDCCDLWFGGGDSIPCFVLFWSRAFKKLTCRRLNPP